MKTVTEWYREQCGWRQKRCHCCVGGLVSDYSGSDFCGPKECSRPPRAVARRAILLRAR